MAGRRAEEVTQELQNAAKQPLPESGLGSSPLGSRRKPSRDRQGVGSYMLKVPQGAVEQWYLATARN